MKKVFFSGVFLALLASPLLAQEQLASSGKDQYDYILKNILNTLIDSPRVLMESIEKGRLNQRFDKEFEKGLTTQAHHALWDIDQGKTYSCDQVCPNNFNINLPMAKRMFPANDDYLLSFTNDKGVFVDSYSRTIGYCWGHTTVTRNFNYLAYYDPNNDLKQKVPSRNNHTAWLNFYKQKIRKIMTYQAQVIPYFSNLFELSSDPDLKVFFKQKVIESWYKQTLSFKNLGHGLSILKRKMSLSAVGAMLDKVERYLAVGIAPKLIVYSQKPGYIHVVSTFKIQREGDRVKVCLLDNHQFSDGLNRCQASLEITKKGQTGEVDMYYYGWDNPEKGLDGTVKRFELAFENDMESLRYKNELVKLCKQVTGCQH